MANPDLFAIPPAVSPTGTLAFTPALNQIGAATITLVLAPLYIALHP